jgi:hypothetical protein
VTLYDSDTAQHGVSAILPTQEAHPWPDDLEQVMTDVRRTWRPVDLTEVLNGTYRPPVPTVGRRGDGIGLFYPGRAHVIAAESEAGKTWFQLAAHADEMRGGNGTVYLDFEDDVGGVVGRLLALGVKADVIGRYFAYIRPEEPMALGRGSDDLTQALGDLRPTLVTVDGVTEGMTLHDLDPLNNKDAARFGRMLVRPITETGAAAVSLDHVTKDKEGRGRYAIGAVHKLNGLNGAMYTLENREPFGVGITGRSGIYIAKDRPGHLRRHSLPSTESRKWFGDLVVASHDASFVEVEVQPPGERADVFRPTALMLKVSEAMERAGQPLNKGDIEARVTGKSEGIRAAIACLVDEGYIELSPRGNARMHTLVRAFTEGAK